MPLAKVSGGNDAEGQGGAGGSGNDGCTARTAAAVANIIRGIARDFLPLIRDGLARRYSQTAQGHGVTSASEKVRGLVGELRTARYVTPGAADDQVGNVIGPNTARRAGTRAVDQHQPTHVGHGVSHRVGDAWRGRRWPAKAADGRVHP